jgi:REP element-mobilizing transposase RayT
MPRPIRKLYPGAHYHVMNRGVRKSDLFHVNIDRRVFLARVGDACMRWSVRCLAYCLMGNHYHLVLRTDKPMLPQAMQWAEARFAEYFNRTYGTKGHVFEARYTAENVETEAYLLEAVRYVLLNPVRAHLCAAPADWPWSSFDATAGSPFHLTWFDRRSVLALFAKVESTAVSSFVRFIAAGDLTNRYVDTLAQAKQDLLDRQIYIARSTGVTMQEIARRFGVSKTTVVRALRRYAEGLTPGVPTDRSGTRSAVSGAVRPRNTDRAVARP